jgi:hypothetical protein
MMNRYYSYHIALSNYSLSYIHSYQWENNNDIITYNYSCTIRSICHMVSEIGIWEFWAHMQIGNDNGMKTGWR